MIQMQQKKPNVVIYSTPTRPHCIDAKEYLKKHKVEFRDIDVSQDREALDEMVQKSGQMGVPVIIIDDETVIVGFDREKLKKALELED